MKNVLLVTELEVTLCASIGTAADSEVCKKALEHLQFESV